MLLLCRYRDRLNVWVQDPTKKRFLQELTSIQGGIVGRLEFGVIQGSGVYCFVCSWSFRAAWFAVQVYVISAVQTRYA